MHTTIINLRHAAPVLGFAVVLLTGACAAPSTEKEDVEISTDLLQTDDQFAEDVTVKESSLELPFAGHESALALQKGKLLVGGPNSNADSVKNPYGFLRRLESVRREGDKIVIATSPAKLSDAVHGKVSLNKTVRVGDPTNDISNAGNVGTQDWSETFEHRIDIPQSTLFEKQLSTGPVNWDVNVGVRGGYVNFAPKVTADIQLDGLSLSYAKLVVDGKVEGDLDVGLLVHASNPTDAQSDLQNFEKVLYTAPRIRWAQWVGFVPVWESLEARVIVRCGLRVRATVDASVGFHATATVKAGGEYRANEGLSGIWEGPGFDFQPRWSADVSGNVYAKCALLPQFTLYAYDAAGPSVTIGPYVEGGLSRTSAGPTKWTADAGFSADVGGRVSVFGYDVVDEHKNLFDKKLASYSGQLPF